MNTLHVGICLFRLSYNLKEFSVFDYLSRPCHLLKGTSPILFICHWVDSFLSRIPAWYPPITQCQCVSLMMTNLGHRLRAVSANFPRFSLLNFHLPASTPSTGSCLSQHSGRWFSKPGFLSFSTLPYLGCKTRSLYVTVTYYSLMMSVWAPDSCFVWWPKGYYHPYRCFNCPRLHSVDLLEAGSYVP